MSPNKLWAKIRGKAGPIWRAIVAFILTVGATVAFGDSPQCIDSGGTSYCTKPVPTPWNYWINNDCDNKWLFCQSALCSVRGGAFVSYDCRNPVPYTDQNLYPLVFAFEQLTAPTFGSACYSLTDTGWGQPEIPGVITGPVTFDNILVRDHRVFNPLCTGPSAGTVDAGKARDLYCPAGTTSLFNGPYGAEACAKPVPDRCAPKSGNPISAADGEKTQIETDFIAGLLTLRRNYSSYGETLPLGHGSGDPKAGSAVWGTNWRSNFSTYLYPITGSSYLAAVVTHADGGIQAYRPDGSQILVRGGSDSKLEMLANGYRLRDGNRIETFDAAGMLLSITEANGRTVTLTYDASGLLQSATDDTGRAIVLTYDTSGHVATISDPAGNSFGYAYDGNGNPTSVTYPDTAVRQYLYENATYVNALTGIIDEKNIRYATYIYDGQGRGIDTEHAGSADKYTFGYSWNNASTTVTDPVGTSRSYNLQVVQGVIKGTGVSQPGGSGCGASSSSITYDANGNVASRRDFSGNSTTYTFDATRNLETQRVEGSGSSSARTISTQWHPDWWLEARRAEPKKVTTWVYNGQPDPTAGNAVASCASAAPLLPNGKPIAVLCKKVEQATTDATGSLGFGATATGSPRTWTWTYNARGQVLTAKGPRTDVNDAVTYTYYADTTSNHTLGDLATLTNAAGATSQFTGYDRNGRLLQMNDANGLVTTFTYTPRGWLSTRQMSSELTRYDYDAVGQLKKATLPDGTWIGYDYDDAHRLTAVYDSLNNRITYTLDAAGNRTQETVTDPNGVLVRTQTRVFDALSRLQNVVLPQ